MEVFADQRFQRRAVLVDIGLIAGAGNMKVFVFHQDPFRCVCLSNDVQTAEFRDYSQRFAPSLRYKRGLAETSPCYIAA